MSDDQAQALETGTDDRRLAELQGLAERVQEFAEKAPDIGFDTKVLHAEPMYCRQCGAPLREEQTLIPQGFHSVDGYRLPDRRHITKTCSSASGSMHVTWVWSEGAWIRP